MSSCTDCICRACLLWWSGRCKYGGCYDDHRAEVEPWPGRERRSWTDWDKPGEQAHGCRGGAFFPTAACTHFVRYDREKTLVRTCLLANVQVFQDGYILCSLVNTFGCEACYRRFEEREAEPWA